jgi:hypothetical protein
MRVFLELRYIYNYFVQWAALNSSLSSWNAALGEPFSRALRWLLSKLTMCPFDFRFQCPQRRCSAPIVVAAEVERKQTFRGEPVIAHACRSGTSTSSVSTNLPRFYHLAFNAEGLVLHRRL